MVYFYLWCLPHNNNFLLFPPLATAAAKSAQWKCDFRMASFPTFSLAQSPAAAIPHPLSHQWTSSYKKIKNQKRTCQYEVMFIRVGIKFGKTLGRTSKQLEQIFLIGTGFLVRWQALLLWWFLS